MEIQSQLPAASLELSTSQSLPTQSQTDTSAVPSTYPFACKWGHCDQEFGSNNEVRLSYLLEQLIEHVKVHLANVKPARIPISKLRKAIYDGPSAEDTSFRSVAKRVESQSQGHNVQLEGGAPMWTIQAGIEDEAMEDEEEFEKEQIFETTVMGMADMAQLNREIKEEKEEEETRATE
ncbi:hypothetical protein BT69DRAFT_1281126 [Atractiella rhizophila]|nr:hypothetical protein BT69DRAFT_1281126 [Atractiella rhizophila]